ncbi:hypothetical protein [Modestobacter sp. Leaf380]|uniref:hypothetical protein n=1 Tax=Modestobacter sp. Leaf380 TaxID=1736356 RepID=UPI0006F3AA4D|nr:hypothetical protein [Modestobacter sp. Leaf380]KQS67629.1 hypothetical protein ASG41_22640 [Modestobacter sp. Leaf380]
MPPRSLSPSEARSTCDTTSRRLWIDYLALGGAWSLREFDDYLTAGVPSGRPDTAPRSAVAVQRDVAAHALNEALMAARSEGRVPYGHSWGWPEDDAAGDAEVAAGARSHALPVVEQAAGRRVLTSVPRGDALDHTLVCGRCGTVLAWSHRPGDLDGLLRCPSCRGLNVLRG